jgi:exodeoxyribonuclease V beta subunit
LSWHDARGHLKVSLVPDADGHARADRERLGEDLRKLYVALTRARYATWVGVAPVANLESSAVGYLIGQGQAPQQALPDVLEAWRDGHPDIALLQAPEPPAHRYRPDAAPDQAGRARVMHRAVRDHWWVASYSSLRTAGAGGQAERAPETASGMIPGSAPETAREDVFLETLEPASADARDANPALRRPLAQAAPPGRGPQDIAGALHDFPSGAQAGTFFHELLEWAAAEGFGTIAGRPDAVRQAVERRAKVRKWSAWTEPLTAWLIDTVARPMALPDMPGGAVAPVALAGLGASISEMEFWLSADNVDVMRLDRIVRSHTLDNAPRPSLEPARINGMLKGFIDLVFEHDGRYYVLDYKSNRLGEDDLAYTPAAMRDAILQHRYELQYALYLFALHRLLRSRLPGYDYDRHIGGAAYMFLRGTRAAHGGVFAERPPAAMVHALDRLFSAAENREEAA